MVLGFITYGHQLHYYYHLPLRRTFQRSGILFNNYEVFFAVFPFLGRDAVHKDCCYADIGGISAISILKIFEEIEMPRSSA